MTKTRFQHFAFALAGLYLCQPGQAQSFTDPAPPKAAAIVEAPSPEPKAFEGLKFRSAPKPLPSGAVTGDWRNFLGPNHNGHSAETALLRNFARTGPPIVWEVSKGEGFATPSVVAGKVLLFHRVGEKETLDCLQAETGKRFWRSSYVSTYSDRYGFNGGPRCQPISDGRLVWTFGAEGRLQCVMLSTGQAIWSRDIVKDFKLKQNFFGVGATPLLEGDLIIVNVGADGGPCVAAFNKLTGKIVWGAGKEWGASYSSPVSATFHGKRRVLVFAGGESRPATGGLLCIDPATGKVDFTFPWRGRRYESVNASSALVFENRIFISECYGMGGALLEVTPDMKFKHLWTSEALGTHFMTAIYKGGFIYGVDGHGPRNAPLVCIDAATGKEKWRKEPEWEETVKLDGGERKINLMSALASLMMVDGACLMVGEYGHIVWLDLQPTGYKELVRGRPFLAPETWGMPALSRGLLYVNQNNRGVDGSEPRLVCLDLRGVGK